MLGFILHGQRHDHEFCQGLLTQVLITWTACWCRMMFMIGRKPAAVVSLRDSASVVQVWRMLSRTYKCVASTVQTLIKLSNPLGGGGGTAEMWVQESLVSLVWLLKHAAGLVKAWLGLQRSASPRGKGQQVLGVEASHAQCVGKF